MKHSLSAPFGAVILVFFSGFLFPLIFSLLDKLLRELLISLPPLLLTILSFSWLLLLYYFGIKFSIDYISEHFEFTSEQSLFTYSNIIFASLNLFSYSLMISPSILSNLLWGMFYLCIMGFFYYLSSRRLLQKA